MKASYNLKSVNGYYNKQVKNKIKKQFKMPIDNYCMLSAGGIPSYFIAIIKPLLPHSRTVKAFFYTNL